LFRFTFTVGDHSDDGHGQYDFFTIDSSHPAAIVGGAYQYMNGQFPIFDTWFDEAEDRTISDEDYDALIALNPDFSKYFTAAKKTTSIGKRAVILDEDVYKFNGGADKYVMLWIDLITHFSPDIELSIVPPTKADVIHGGGYGLYWI